MKTLAIVIPAYKDCFLSDTLSSLASQTCKDFVVYVGDDNSPNAIEKVVTLYQDKLHIIYHRFDTNAGSKSLVQQWYRCVNMTQEDYIWLFSDDDILPVDAVERFWNFEKHHTFDICRLPLELIDKDGQPFLQLEDYPANISSLDYLKMRLQGRILSSASEYIFNRKRYEECGFVEFPLAWCSDDASWAKMGTNRGISTIQGKPVGFRISGENISSQKDNLLAKIQSETLFVSWIHCHFPEIEERYFYNYLCARCLKCKKIGFGKRFCIIMPLGFITIWHRFLLVCNSVKLYKIAKYV